MGIFRDRLLGRSQVGKRIEHRTYGKGQIVESRYLGFELRVRFDNGLSRWIRKNDVRFLTETFILPKQEAPEAVLSKEQFKARKMIEAFRLGIVPHEHVGDFTLGREVEIARIRNWLNQTNEGAQILIGEYGSGKTHFLDFIYSSALQNNWAVSLVELDPNELAFHKPKRIYEAVTNTFCFQRGGYQCNFRDFLKTIARNSDSHKIEGHKYLEHAIRSIKNGEDDESFWNWIEGRPGVYGKPPMYDDATCSNIYCYILSGIGCAARNILGLNGLLILFDEAESVERSNYTYYQSKKVLNVLKGFILVSNNDERLLSENIEEHASPTGYWGAHTGLQYSGRMRFPVRFLWGEHSYLKCIFTFVPHEILDTVEPLNTIPRIELENIGEEFLPMIFEKVSLIYEQAYNTSNNNNIFEILPRNNIRKFIKSSVEAFDLLRFHPNQKMEELLL